MKREGQTDEQIERLMNRFKDRCIDRDTGLQIERQMNRWRKRQAS